jgi:hypothetical protein
MRCPSEHLLLRWCDIDWANNRIHITSPKTEHHVGGESRVAPLFPELRPFLEDCFEQAEDGAEFVITRYREATQNLGTQGKRIVRKAGLKPWPKLFQNLRSTRETELAEDYPMHVVCAWIGNSQPIAAKHYLQVTDAHFSRAAGNETDAQAVQNPVQQSHETPRNGSQVVNTAQKETPTFAGDFSSLRRNAVNNSYPARTRTPDVRPRENVGETISDSAGAAFSGAVGAADVEGEALTEVPEHSRTDPALILLIEVWEKLPDSAKSQILRFADAAQPISVRAE